MNVNGLRLGAVADIEALNCQTSKNFDRSTMPDLTLNLHFCLASNELKLWWQLLTFFNFIKICFLRKNVIIDL
jgi:hypothetical protein